MFAIKCSSIFCSFFCCHYSVDIVCAFRKKTRPAKPGCKWNTRWRNNRMKMCNNMFSVYLRSYSYVCYIHFCLEFNFPHVIPLLFYNINVFSCGSGFWYANHRSLYCMMMFNGNPRKSSHGICQWIEPIIVAW